MSQPNIYIYLCMKEKISQTKSNAVAQLINVLILIVVLVFDIQIHSHIMD